VVANNISFYTFFRCGKRGDPPLIVMVNIEIEKEIREEDDLYLTQFKKSGYIETINEKIKDSTCLT
jgi:hypothetical protein